VRSTRAGSTPAAPSDRGLGSAVDACDRELGVLDGVAPSSPSTPQTVPRMCG